MSVEYLDYVLKEWQCNRWCDRGEDGDLEWLKVVRKDVSVKSALAVWYHVGFEYNSRGSYECMNMHTIRHPILDAMSGDLGTIATVMTFAKAVIWALQHYSIYPYYVYHCWYCFHDFRAILTTHIKAKNIANSQFILFFHQNWWFIIPSFSTIWFMII